MKFARSHRRGAVLAAAAYAVLVCAALALAGCQSSRPATGSSPSATATALTQQQLLAIGQEYSACIRSHGVANYPDLVVAAGQLTLPDNASGDAGDQALRANTAARDACAPILQRLPASAQKGALGPTAADRASLLKYAQCMRDNGIAEWPDPQADGSFPIANTPLDNEGKSARMTKATAACKQYYDKEISVK